mmetsp:Transcript_18677/g.55045  ORF Transcript_18677/g.55045 Transcript_18677/m.55045 type:complete len:224 (-) Transcript_18677:29-700(-)
MASLLASRTRLAWRAVELLNEPGEAPSLYASYYEAAAAVVRQHAGVDVVLCSWTYQLEELAPIASRLGAWMDVHIYHHVARAAPELWASEFASDLRQMATAARASEGRLLVGEYTIALAGGDGEGGSFTDFELLQYARWQAAAFAAAGVAAMAYWNAFCELGESPWGYRRASSPLAAQDWCRWVYGFASGEGECPAAWAPRAPSPGELATTNDSSSGGSLGPG